MECPRCSGWNMKSENGQEVCLDCGYVKKYKELPTYAQLLQENRKLKEEVEYLKQFRQDFLEGGE